MIIIKENQETYEKIWRFYKNSKTLFFFPDQVNWTLFSLINFCTRTTQKPLNGKQKGKSHSLVSKGRDPFNQNFRKFRSKTQWIGSVQPEKFRKNRFTFWGGPLFPVGPVWILVEWIAPKVFILICLSFKFMALKLPIKFPFLFYNVTFHFELIFH